MKGTKKEAAKLASSQRQIDRIEKKLKELQRDLHHADDTNHAWNMERMIGKLEQIRSELGYAQALSLKKREADNE